MNIKPYSSGKIIKRIEKPTIGKPLNKIEIQIEELDINFSINKQNRVIGKIKVINAVIRLSDKVNEPIYRFIKKHNRPKHKISFKQSRRSILNFVF